MKKISVQQSKALTALAATLAFCSATSASVVYDNSTTDLNRTYAGGNGVEFGDEVVLGGSDRTITEFRFETFLNSASGNEEGVLKFRLNDGAQIASGQNAPSSIIYQSLPFSIGSGRQTVVASGLSVQLPANVSNFTWTLTVSGIESGEQAGLMLYDPPTKGSSFVDFWQNTGGTWGTYLIDGGNIPANFAAKITAIPEPSTLALGAVGAIALAGYAARRRKLV